MNKNDQKYLLNSEILVIVQHMMIKRHQELEGEGEEEVSDSMDDDVCSDDNVISSDEHLFDSFGADSPPLAASDLCSTDVDTDELLSDGSDSENVSPQIPETSAAPKKSESFFRFLVKRARKWRKRKMASVADKRQDPEVKLSTVCNCDSLNASASQQHSGSSSIIHTAAKIKPILDERNLTTEQQPAEDNSRMEATQASSCKSSKSFSGCLRPPGLMIPKMGYFGLSEGNIPEALLRSDSEESVNRILSEESLLGDYLRDISESTCPRKDHLQIPNAAIRKLVTSMESLSVRCKSVESLSRAIYKSLIDLRDSSDIHHLKSLKERRDDQKCASLFIEEEADIDLYMNQASLATPETTPNFYRARSCEPFSVDTRSSLELTPISSLQIV